MCSRHAEPGAGDPAQGLADAIAVVEAAGIHVGPALPACRVCSDRALPDDRYCKQHRLRAEEEARL